MNELKQSTDVDIDEAREAVREFQDFTNLNPNGKLNRRTLNEMNKPRCGNRDLRVETGDEVGIEWSGRDARRRRRKRYDSPGTKMLLKQLQILFYCLLPYMTQTTHKTETLNINSQDVRKAYWILYIYFPRSSLA
jgi:hypothetical protein